MAEGAGLWFTKRLVVARAARAYYGIDSMRVYNPDDPEHVLPGEGVNDLLRSKSKRFFPHISDLSHT